MASHNFRDCRIVVKIQNMSFIKRNKPEYLPTKNGLIDGFVVAEPFIFYISKVKFCQDDYRQ